MEPSSIARILPVFGQCGYVAHCRTMRLSQHNTSELVFILQGSCAFRVGPAHYDARRGDLLVIPRETPHLLRPREPTAVYTCLYEAETTVFDSRRRRIELESERWAPRWFEELYEMGKVSRADGQAVCDGLLFALLRRIELAEKQQSRQETMHPALRRALHIIHRRLTEHVHLPDLARRALVSPSYLTALFHESFGCGPIRYQQNQRLEYAARLLDDRSLSIGDIAFQCGYADANYFSRMFRRRTGQSPSAFREGRATSGDA
jgi:AraC-like DNA-binding protein